ncbi:nucleoid occlusion factor SlmA [Cellvibrio sp.]|uniref:nucleoid occlusion factor SlmA n=1 Tax=Cellvibrio sp. TaxID=1965322 RepID=UPI0039647916
MSKLATPLSRREQILTALAKMLEASPGERITTAILAKAVGVSEAALYRHFPSKTKMFEGLIEYIEDTVFSKITLILAEEKSPTKRCEMIVKSILLFVERNPGLSRLLVGDALTGETERLRQRIVQFFERIETQLKQILRDAESRHQIDASLPAAAFAHLLVAYIDGVLVRFVRSEFQMAPTELWIEQWCALTSLLVKPELADA